MKDRFDADGEELARLTDRVNNPPNTIDDTRLQQALDDASAEIDSHLARAYKMPILGCLKSDGSYLSPPVLVRYCCDIARYTLYDNKASNEEVYRRYKAALDWLSLVAKKELFITCPVPESTGELVSGLKKAVLSSSDCKVFTKPIMNNFTQKANNCAC